MALQAGEFERLQSDFRSGRNPKAYIPLCQELRRRKRHGEALTVCQAGLVRDTASIAGRTELVRILAELGRFEEGLREVEKAERRTPDAFGLRMQKLRCQLRLRRLDDAGATLATLEAMNPMEPTLGALRAELQRAMGGAVASRAEIRKPVFDVRLTGADFVRFLRSNVQALGKVLAVALVDLEKKQSFLEGDDHLAEIAAQFERETSQACQEMGHGSLSYGMIETHLAMVMAVRRGSKLVVVATDPGLNYGKLQHRVMLLVDRHFPAPSGARAGDDETT